MCSSDLAGLAGARGRGRAEKTRATIRKINDVVLAQYESYAERQVTGMLSVAAVPAAGTNDPYDVVRILNSGTFYGPRAISGAWPGPLTGAAMASAQSQLAKRRLLMAYEMPDSWADVQNSVSAVVSGSAALPAYCRTGAVQIGRAHV